VISAKPCAPSRPKSPRHTTGSAHPNGKTIINKIVKRFSLLIIDRYIIRKFLSTFFFSIALIMAIAVVFDFSEKIDDFWKAKLR